MFLSLRTRQPAGKAYNLFLSIFKSFTVKVASKTRLKEYVGVNQ